MMLNTLHKLASAGPVYDSIQTACGIKLIYRRFRRILGAYSGFHTVLDFGGGTGRFQSLMPANCKYYCLDNEAPKLQRFRSRTAGALAILGDATTTPVAGARIDLAVCLAVSHHLNDFELQQMLSEIKRVLRPGGHLMFYDALWRRSWLPGRLLWSLDRGSNPRTKETLLGILTQHLRIIHQEEFRLGHEYLVLVASNDESRL